MNFNQFEKVFTIIVNQAGFYGIPRGLALERAEQYLKQLQLWDKRDTVARALSGGMKRRLMIARALVHEPRLLILDEPTAGVDIEIRRSMWAFLREINERGTTIILTTHYLEEAESLCRHIAIIDDGRIIENDTMTGVLRKLSQESFVLNFRCATAAVPQLPGYVTKLVDDHTIEVDVMRDQGLNDMFARLSQQGIEVVSMRNKVNRLEELFMRLVEDDAAQAAEVIPRAHPAHRLPDHHAARVRPHHAHLGPDARAAGHHGGAVLRDLRQPHRPAHRADGRLRLHAVHRARASS